ncbi:MULTISPECIES: GntR family transcriptional regulator [Oceanotoga]|uniref:GntR family transcriptional regulator n=1 Tax=Oceanotoga teriensis TaxID=515440 RepID=A0AA45HIQ2_9BACT|nr:MULTISPECIES: GntR family transcriptional regulator [Oceanotoga]MDN5342228.1 GntR family transcriptional regulator [Oceanotoga sp.]PWJ93242.1 GntR family transcriptional regulator [Oceanotoga teriensis]
MIGIDKNSGVPLYKQVMDDLERKIINGVYKIGELIPPEPELMSAYNVSRITIRRAIDDLSKKGYLDKRPGKGTFVINKHISMGTQEKIKLKSFSQKMRDMNIELHTKILSFKRVKVDIKSFDKAIPTNSHYYLLKRQRSINKEIIMEFDTYVSCKYDLEDLLENPKSIVSLYEIFNDRNIVLRRSVDYMEAILGKDLPDMSFEIEDNIPLLKKTRVSYDVDGDMVEYTEIYYKPSKYIYSNEYIYIE